MTLHNVLHLVTLHGELESNLTNVSNHDTHGQGSHNDIGIFLYPFVCLATGVFFDSIVKTRGMATVLLLATSFGMTLLTLFCLGSEWVLRFMRRYTWVEMDPHVIMFALLPTLIFESAYALEAHDFKKYCGQVLVLAGPAFVVTFLLLGCMLNVLMISVGEGDLWPLGICLLYGAVVSATDPIAVVSLLKQLGVPHHLNVLIEGESLFNDGAAIFFHGLIHQVLTYTMGVEPNVNLKAELGVRLVAVIGSVLIGYVYARVASVCLGTFYEDSVCERAVVVVFVYASYVSAEVTRGSGVLCLVAFGIALNSRRESMSREAYADNKRMWGFLAYFANCIIFIITGQLTAIDLYDGVPLHIAYGVFAYGLSVISRAVALILFTGVLRWFGPYPVQYSAVLIWGGLRGSLALLLALQAKDDSLFRHISGDTDKNLYKTTLGFVSVTVILSNLLQGISSGPLTSKLKLGGMTNFQMSHLRTLAKRVNVFINEKMVVKRRLPQYAEANWAYVLKHVTVSALKGIEKQSGDDQEEQARECIQRCLEAHVWNLWHSGVLSVNVRQLQNAIAESTHVRGPLNVNHLFEHLQPSRFWSSTAKVCRSVGNKLGPPAALSFLVGKPRLSDAWQLLLSISGCVLSGLCLYIYLRYGETRSVPKRLMFMSCLMALTLGAEPLLRLWIHRSTLRKIFIQQHLIWPWFDQVASMLYLVLFAVHLVIFHRCSTVCDDCDSLLLGASIAPTCSAMRKALLVSLFGLIKLPLALFLLFRLIGMEVEIRLQRHNEETLEVMNALVIITETLQRRLASGTLIKNAVLRRMLTDECRGAKVAAEDKLIELFNSQGGAPMLVTIKTRQVTRELLHEILLFLSNAEQSGDLAEDEAQQMRRSVDMLRRKAQKLHKPFTDIKLSEKLRNMDWVRENLQDLDALVKQIQLLGKMQELKKGNVLFKQGDPADCVYFVLSGFCHVKIKDTVTGQERDDHLAHAGTMFGGTVLISHNRRSTLVAATPVTALRLDKNALSKLPGHLQHSLLERYIEERCADYLRDIRRFHHYSREMLEEYVLQWLKQASVNEIIPATHAKLILFKGQLQDAKNVKFVGDISTPVKIGYGHSVPCTPPLTVLPADGTAFYLMEPGNDKDDQEFELGSSFMKAHVTTMLTTMAGYTTLPPETQMPSSMTNVNMTNVNMTKNTEWSGND